jgi:hypothetical protein
MTRQWCGGQRNCMYAFGCSNKFIFPVKGPDRLRFLVCFLFNEYWRNFNRGQRNLGVNLTSHLHLASKLRMNATMTPLLHLPLWSAKGNFTSSVMVVYLTTLTVIPNHWITVHNKTKNYVPRWGRASYNLLLKNFPAGSQWPRRLRLAGNVGSNPARGIVQSLVSVLCVCVLSGRDLCVDPITLPEKPYWMWCFWVWSRNLNDEEA